MTTEVQIAKMALQHFGDRFDISTLHDASTEAEQVHLVFETARDMVLREHPWNFATSFVSPTASADTPPANWTYMFDYPSDALKIRRIVNPLGRDINPIKFAVGLYSGNKMIFCDEEEPEFEYTSQITDTFEFDPHFVMALSFKIAELIAMPLTGDRGIKQDMRRDYRESIELAQAEDANEGVEQERPNEADWITARA